VSPAPLGVGLIGCGAIVRAAHLPALVAISDARVIAVADPDPASVDAARSRLPEARPFSSAEALLRGADIDAVVVAVPSALHADVAVGVLDAGKHLYLEKPIATDLADGRRVVDAWRRAGRVGVIGFNYRRNPLHESAAALLRRGAIGKPLTFRTVFSTFSPDAGPTRPWRHERAAGGGALLDLASHHIDLIRFLSGAEVIRVSAHVDSHRSEDDTAALLLELSTGCTADIFVTMSSAETDVVEIYGESGRIVVDRYRHHTVRVDPLRAHRSARDYTTSLADHVRGLRYAVAKRRAIAHEPSFARTMQAFVDSCRANRAMNPDLGDGFASLAVVVAAEEAARSGRSVDVSPGST
jgi:myo-inositol 2-dehydrogenase / D-chiro-inositol 1-dehydrogenase